MILSVGYGFQGTGRPLGEYHFVSNVLAGNLEAGRATGNRFRGTPLESLHMPLPEDYVIGVDLQRVDFEAEWPFYLNGNWTNQGVWVFYIYALAWKVPLGCWGLLLAALYYLIFKRLSAGWCEESLIWLPDLAILVLVSSQTGLNYFRYAIPLLPFALIGASRCGQLITWQSKWQGTLVVGFVVAAVFSSLSIYPHSLSYFNEAVVGPQNAHRHLVDNNLDWGQDLLYLKEWLGQHPDHGKLQLAYFNFVDPRIVGIDYELPANEPRPGLYAVSVHFVQGGTFLIADGNGKRLTIPLHRYEYFQQFRPIANAGYTIWIYELAAQIDEVRTQQESQK